MSRNPCHGWADKDTVTFLKCDGTPLATGEVVVRKSNQGRWYLKVCLKTAGTGLGRYGEWLWPEGWTWGTGKHLSRCMVGCEQPYLTDDIEVAKAEFCPPCERKESKERAKAGTAIRNITGYLIEARSKR